MQASDRKLYLTEAQLQEMIIARARALSWLVYHTYDSRRSTAGFPDLVLARKGHVIFVEVKSEKGRLTGAQAEWLRVLGIGDPMFEPDVYVWRPSDMAEIEKVLAHDH